MTDPLLNTSPTKQGITGLPTVIFNAVHDTDLGTGRVLELPDGSATGRTGFRFPDDMRGAPVSVTLRGSPVGSAAGANRDIDFTVQFGSVGEDFDEHTASDTTSTYDLNSLRDEWFDFDLTALFVDARAGDTAGILIEHQYPGNGDIRYSGVKVEYRR